MLEEKIKPEGKTYENAENKFENSEYKFSDNAKKLEQ